MIYAWDQFELDLPRFELRRENQAVAVEPQVLAVLHHLIARDRELVTRDELIEAVWSGRAISDAAIASRIKSARRAIGDDGSRQRYIATVHGLGWRFTTHCERRGSVRAVRRFAEADTPPSIAILPLACAESDGLLPILAEALPHDVIADLSRSRWLRVIARGSTFRLTPDTRGDEISRALGARYALTGSIGRDGSAAVVSIELAEVENGAILWAERFRFAAPEIQEVRARLARAVVSALELRIPLREADVACRTPNIALSPWAAYHLGLRHMFHFTAADNAEASRCFAHAVAQDRDFARAHAGLSFTSFQNAFLSYSSDRALQASAARRHAERALGLDPLDPFANFVMGRSFWLEGDLALGEEWLDRAIMLNPNYAHGIYAKAWSEVVRGDGDAGQSHADTAMDLSPIDPLRYAMAATRALSHLVRGDAAAAAAWAESAASEPGAHVHIAAIACAVQALAGNELRAARWAAAAIRQKPSYCSGDFFCAFPFADPSIREAISGALAAHDL